MRYTRSEVTVIFADDPSVVGDGSYDRYAAAGFDESMLSLVPGVEPERYTIGAMRYDARRHWYDLDGFSKIEFAFRACLRSIRSCKQIGVDGEMTVPQVRHVDDPQHGRLVSMDWVRETSPPVEIMTAVAHVGIMLSEGKIPFLRSCVMPSTDGA